MKPEFKLNAAILAGRGGVGIGAKRQSVGGPTQGSSDSRNAGPRLTLLIEIATRIEKMTL